MFVLDKPQTQFSQLQASGGRRGADKKRRLVFGTTPLLLPGAEQSAGPGLYLITTQHRKMDVVLPGQREGRGGRGGKEPAGKGKSTNEHAGV